MFWRSLFWPLYLAALIGAFISKRRAAPKEGEHESFNLVMTSTLTLLALLIGFSFSMAVSRYDQRKIYEEDEANAIGTEYLRADLLPPAAAQTVRTLLIAYLNQRILFYETRDEGQLQKIDAETAQTADRSVVSGSGSGCGDPFARDGPCCFGNERRLERAGIHSGQLVEPNSKGGVAADGRNLYFIQYIDWVWDASEGNQQRPASYLTAYFFCLIFPYI